MLFWAGGGNRTDSVLYWLIPSLNVFALRKTTTYALFSLAHMANRPADCISAREIAVAHALPPPLLMKVLKVMHAAGILRSVRGVKGGYQIATDLEQVSLYDLTNHLQSGLTDQGEDVFRARKRRSWLGTDAKPSPAPVL